MATQAVSTLVPADIDLGNALVYYSPTTFSTFSSAKSATTWRKLGQMKDGVQLDVPREFAKVYSGFPSKLVKQYIASEALNISGAIAEFNPFNLARVFGGLDLTVAVKSSSPTPTTATSGSTKSVVKVASATGFAAGDLIKVGTQYGRIKSIASLDLTLYEGLSADTNPTTGDAVSKVDTASFKIGSLAAPTEYAIKISKTQVGGPFSWNCYIPRAIFAGNPSLAFPDNSASPTDILGVPFAIEALADADIESGNLAMWEFTHN